MVSDAVGRVALDRVAPQVTEGRPAFEESRGRRHARSDSSATLVAVEPAALGYTDFVAAATAGAAALRAAVGLVPQRTSDAFLGRSVLEELTLFRDDVTTPDDVRRTLDAVGLGAVSLLAPPPSLSGGQQRRLALASQLLRQPRVRLLLLDEPLAGVDGGARRGIAALLGRVKAALAGRSGLAVLGLTGGEAGLARMWEVLSAEMSIAMAQTGLRALPQHG